jgi:spermidine synthase
MALFRVRLTIAVALLSLAVVAFEIQLIHLFTIVQWHHFAYMIIAIALLGFGASGTLIAIFRGWFLKREERLLPLLMILSGALMTLAVRLSRSDLFVFDSYTLFVDRAQFWKLLATYILCFLPFLSAGLAIGLIFVSKVARIGTYYFADLVGAGLGGLLVIILLWRFSPQQVTAVIALLPIIAGGMIIRGRSRMALFAIAMAGLAAVLYQFNTPFSLRSSQFKGISYALDLPEAHIKHERSSPYGLTQVVAAPTLRYAPGLSFTFTDTVPTLDIIYNNGDMFAAIPNWTSEDTTHLLDHTTMALPYALAERPRVLLLGAGAGLELSHALRNQAYHVTAVEPNAMVTALLREEYAIATDSLFYHPNLALHTLRSRAFLDRTEDNYDLIQLPLLGTFGGTDGLNALQESHLLTKEALAKMWDLLTPEGMIALSAWMDMPPKMSLKLAASIHELMRDEGIKTPRDYMVAVRSWGTITFVIKRHRFDTTDIQSVLDFCERYNFDTVFLPDEKAEEMTFYNSMEDEGFFQALEVLFSRERDALIADYDFNIRPATDNKPYFFNFIRWRSLSKLFDSIGKQSTLFSGLGYFIVVVTCIQAIILALLLIILPLFKLGWRGRHKSWVLIYFCALGSGYMFLEIAFIKYFISYLGHPIYSVAMVISVMLISSGLGSYYSSRLKPQQLTIKRVCGIVALCILIYVIGLAPVLSATQGMALALKVALSALMVALPSFFMGMPFPVGLKVVNNLAESHVPWAWGINGCVSVISTSLAAIMAVELGFLALILVAFLAYGVAFMSMRFESRGLNMEAGI